jgi:sulfur-oxidizing protein SoxX
MRKFSTFFTALGAAVLLAGSLSAAPAYAGPGKGGEMPDKKTCAAATDPVVIGGCLATNRKKGNCHACHSFAGVEKTRLQVGNIAPPLVGMKARFPDKAKLKAQIYDAQVANPHTVMPPYGKHSIISDKEIDYIVEFLYTL